MASAELWIIGTLVTICLAAFGTLGTILKVAYDISTDLHIVMYGDDKEHTGFIKDTQEQHKLLAAEQDAIQTQLTVQGRILNELVYTVAELSESLETDDVDLERLQDLRDERDDL